jgi:hypothetical protein
MFLFAISCSDDHRDEKTIYDATTNVALTIVFHCDGYRTASKGDWPYYRIFLVLSRIFGYVEQNYWADRKKFGFSYI